MPYLPPNTFTGGWNTDDSPLTFPKSDWNSCYYLAPYNFNAGVGTQPNLISPLGNAQLPIGTLPAGDNIIIGAAPWEGTNTFIVAYWNSNGDHSLWQISELGAAAVEVLIDPILNFQKTMKLYGMCVVDGVLKWTDGYFESFLEDGSGYWQFNPPRELDIQKAIYYSAGNPLGYTAITEQTLDVIKWPPPFGPSVAYATDTGEESNRVYGALWQFMYWYRYDTGAQSRPSPISEVALPSVSDNIAGRNYLDPNADNRIDITVETGAEVITQIIIAVRKGNTGQFGIIAQLDKELLGIGNNTTYVYEFYNDTPTKPVSLSIDNYDLVPQVAGRQAIVQTRESSSVMAYGDIYEGYDKIETDVTLAYQLNDITDTFTLMPVFIYRRDSGDINNTQLFYESPLTVIYSFMEGDTITFSFSVAGTQTQVTYTVTAGDITAILALATNDERIEYITETIGDYCATQLGTTGSLNTVTNIYTLVGNYEPSLNINQYTVINRPTNPQKSVKTGVRYEVGIQYYDRGNRDATVLSVGEIYIDSQVEQNKSTLSDPNNPYSVSVRISIDHVPPQYASHYQVVFKEVNPKFQHRSVTRLVAEGVNRVKLSLERFYLDRYGVVFNNGLTGGAKINYTPQQGDIVRFLRKAIPVPGNADQAPYCTIFTEVEVLAYSNNEGENNSECIWVTNFDWQTLLGDSDSYGGFLIEIMNPIQTQQVGEEVNAAPWREGSDWFEILNPYTATRAHAGNVQNQVNGGVPAISVLGYYNCYVRPRHMGSYYDNTDHSNAVWWVEDPYYSDYYSSDAYNIGKIAIEDINAKRKRLIADIRHSKSLVQNTNINGLNTFTFEDKVALGEGSGAISFLVQIGDTLKALQTTQETSIYLQQAYSIVPDGSGNTAFTDRVFGGVRPMQTNFGTDQAGLVCVVDQNLYYFDRLQAKFIQSNQGGQVNLSDGRFKFSKGSYSVQTTLNGYIGTALTPENSAIYNGVSRQIEFWVGAEDGGTYSSQAYVFNLDRGRWTHNMTHGVRFGWSIGSIGYSSIGEDVSQYSTSAGTMEFNGIDPTTLTSTISITVGDGPLQLKVPLNLTLWISSAPTTCLITGNVPNAALVPFTTVLNGAWQLLENKYVAPIGKDETDPAFSDGALAKISGRDLRSNSFTIDFTFAGSSTAIRLYALSLNVRQSLPTP